MTRQQQRRTLTRALTSMALLFGGCAGLRAPQLAKEGISTERNQRKDAVIDKFDSQRSKVQYDAAILSWENADEKGCESALLELLARDPSYLDARRLLADLYTEQGNAEGAYAQLQMLLEQNPRDSQTHHSMGLLLESLGRNADAIAHYNQASIAEPDNELYRLSQQACRMRLEPKDVAAKPLSRSQKPL